jgi:predicted nucleic acid-binding protein
MVRDPKRISPHKFVSSAGMNSVLAGAKKIYIDANVVIYFVEGNATFQGMAERVFAYVDEKAIPLITSEIALAECLYGAHRLERYELVGKYQWIFYKSNMIHLVPVGIGICETAAKLGAQNRLKLIDALHFATALGMGCDIFVTNDKGIKSINSLRVVQLPEV